MGTARKRGQGAMEELSGKIKAGIGKLIGNQQMELEGRATELKGVAKQEGAKAAERGKGKVDELVGKAKGGIGVVTDNKELEGEGRAQETLGKARQELNR